MSAPAAPTLNGTEPLKARKEKPSILAPIGRYLARFDDGELIRWVFRGVLVGTIAVLAQDAKELYEQSAVAALQPATETATPVLPPAAEPDGDMPADPRRFVTGEPETLRLPMRFSLGGGGVLQAEGAIDQGSADRLAKELEARGEYVRIVSLNSPGGALQDAIAMAKLIRERKLDTEVPDGALCASSCPLIFAGGVKRLAGKEAAIGVHQFFATTAKDAPAPSDPAQALSDAQMTTARISRHLGEMGVDPAIWLHALDTPPQALYYFSTEELAGYRLATGASKPRTEAAVLESRARPTR
jgi:hypothetical protein